MPRKYLIQALNDKTNYVRRDIVRALRYLGDKDAIPAITERLDDPDEDVRRCAKIALDRIVND